MNKCVFIGRISKDIDVRNSQGENSTTIARFSIAVDRKFKKEGEATADFINCIAFGKQAEFCEKWLNKGSKIAITSHVQCGSYTNKDGIKVYTTDFVIEEIEFAESKGNSGSTSAPSSKGDQKNGKPNEDGFMNIPDGLDDEELPFS